ncbi:MAG TPA: GIY-YIG nuclease family protein [Candidatus Nitrosocosmicus sp.]|nr:GIY-YIG nuclease family protein [Candidatus Nitrosocosmicus sp.]
MSIIPPIYYTYILECSDGTYYVGKTSNLEKRLKQHNGLLPKGAKYTRARKPSVIKYYEAYETSSLAMKREYVLKQLSHKEKEVLIKSFNKG